MAHLGLLSQPITLLLREYKILPITNKRKELIMIITKYLSQVGSGYRISEHFVLGEFACRGSDKVIYDTDILVVLETLRAYYGGPIKITSGYRTPAVNTALGSNRTSAHLYGQAADFVVKNHVGTTVPSRTICLHLEAIGWKGSTGKMNTAVHIDTRYANRMDETKTPYLFLNHLVPPKTWAQYFGYQQMTVKNPVINVRSKPTTSSSIVGMRTIGQKVFIFETAKDSLGREWAKINFVKPQWVAKWLLK